MIIMEGANGGGKTSYARALSGLLDAPLYRAFRRPGADHHNGNDMERLQNLGVPVNTWMDDMYLADLSRIIGNEVIVDRSMPSAVVYEIVQRQGTMRVDWVHYMTEWERLLKMSVRPALVVHLVAPYEVACERMTGHKPSEDEYWMLGAWYDRVLSLLDIPVLTIDTSVRAIPSGVRMVKERMAELCLALNNSASG